MRLPLAVESGAARVSSGAAESRKTNPNVSMRIPFLAEKGPPFVLRGSPSRLSPLSPPHGAVHCDVRHLLLRPKRLVSRRWFSSRFARVTLPIKGGRRTRTEGGSTPERSNPPRRRRTAWRNKHCAPIALPAERAYPRDHGELSLFLFRHKSYLIGPLKHRCVSGQFCLLPGDSLPVGFCDLRDVQFLSAQTNL